MGKRGQNHAAPFCSDSQPAEISLSAALRDLARRSDPREQRTTGGDGRGARSVPWSTGTTSPPISFRCQTACASSTGDAGVGRPHVDLGFLIGADRDVTQEEVEAVVEQYGSHAPVDRNCLAWHRQRWADLVGKARPGNGSIGRSRPGK